MSSRRPPDSTSRTRAHAVLSLGLLLGLLLSLFAVPPTAQAVPQSPIDGPVDGPQAGHRSLRVAERVDAGVNGPDYVKLPRHCIGDDGYPAGVMCRLTPQRKGAPTLVLWGDSHAWHMVPAIRRAIGTRKINLVTFLLGGCPPMYPHLRGASSPKPSNGCERFGDEAMRWIQARKREGLPMRVVLGTSWELYNDVVSPKNEADARFPGVTNDWIDVNAWRGRSATKRAFKTLGQLGIPTDVIGQMPMIYLTAPSCPQGPFRCDLPRWGVIKDPKANNARIESLRALLKRPGRLIRPARSLCDKRVCHGTIAGTPVYYDGLHIGARTSRRLLTPYFVPTVNRLLAQAR